MKMKRIVSIFIATFLAINITAQPCIVKATNNEANSDRISQIQNKEVLESGFQDENYASDNAQSLSTPSTPTSSQVSVKDIYFKMLDDKSADIKVQCINSQSYLLLPSCIKPNQTALYYDFDDAIKIKGAGSNSSQTEISITSGQKFDLGALFNSLPEDNKYPITIDNDSEVLNIVFSDQIPSLFLDIDESKGTINDMHKDKSNNCYGGSNIADENSLESIKSLGTFSMRGRGNATWLAPKKPYQIKFDKKTEVLGMKSAKTWILLANHYDPTLARNATAFDIAKALNMGYTPEYKFVDLYMNGEYLGNYTICEKIQINKSRLNITDLEDNVDSVISEYNKTNKANYSNLSELYSVGAATLNEDKTICTVNTGKNKHEINLTGGYLLEFDYYDDNPQIKLSDGRKVTIKSPENLGSDIHEACYAHINKYIKEADEAILSDNGYNKMGLHYSKYIDLESFAKMWLIKEYSMDYDAVVSMYMYKDADGILKAGPVWDFDNAFARESGAYPNNNYNVIANGGFHQLMSAWLTKLMCQQDFLNQLVKTYNDSKSVFSNDHCYNLAKNNIEKLKDSANVNLILWSNEYSDKENQRLLQFTRDRDNYMNSYMNQIKQQGVDIVKRPLKNGVYAINSHVGSSKVLDVDNGSNQDGANIQIYDKNDSDAQYFLIKSTGDGYYTIMNINSGKVLDVAGAGQTPGTNVQQYSSNGSDAQKWAIRNSGWGSYKLYSKCSGLYMDINQGSNVNGANVQTHSMTSTKAQMFNFSPITLIPDNVYTVVSSLDASKALDVANAEFGDGTNVQLYSDNGSNAQKFEFKHNGEGYYTITNVNSGKVLDIANAGQAPGTNVQQYSGNGSDAQKWRVKTNSDCSYTFISKCNGLCIDVFEAQTFDGNNIQVYSGNSSNAQRFFVK